MSHADRREGLVELDRATCWQRLRDHEGGVGRIALVAGGRPHLFPVNYAFESGTVLIRTDSGLLLDAATNEDVVAFEIDEADAAHRSGWSVTIAGTAQVVRDRRLEIVLARLDFQPYPQGRSRRWVAIDVEEINGREVVHPFWW